MKPFNKILIADDQYHFLKHDKENHSYWWGDYSETVDLAIEDHYSNIKKYELPNFVNHEVGSQFDIALHIAFYAYFDWLLWDVAALKAILSYELLLMIIYMKKIDASDKKGKKTYFPGLIGYAHADNLINNKEFDTGKMFLKEMRNSFSHGCKGIAGDNNSFDIIGLCRDIIVNVTTGYQSRQDNAKKSKDKAK